MPHAKTALALMVALALPGAAQALGLGELHLDSALNEPLAANIDIVGATAEDLAGISASVANRETFEHFEIDRPEFLSTVVFKVSRDSRGRAILAIRSTEACTEPVLNMLVDLRWRGGELVRQYTLLLDLPGLPSATVAAAAGGPASNTAPVSVHPAVSEKPIETSKPKVDSAPASKKARTTAGGTVARKTVRVGAEATLRGIAWRVGARSEADLTRMMVAIYRANANGFEGNINRLRRGAVLTIPSATEVAAISAADADHEVHAQMEAWHAPTAAAGMTRSVAPAVAAAGPSPAEPAVPSSPAAAETALARRVEQLESRLGELQDQFEREHDALVSVQARLTLAESAPAAVAAQTHQPSGTRSSIAAILALAAAAFGVYAWRRRRAAQPRLSPAEPEMQHLAPDQVTAQAPVEKAAAPGTPLRAESRAVRGEQHNVAHEMAGARSAPPSHTDHGDAIDVEALEASYLLQGSGGGFEDIDHFGDTAILPATGQLAVDDPSAQTMPVATATIGGSDATSWGLRAQDNPAPATKAAAGVTQLDYNLLDLDATVQHVQMPSALHENVGFKERRTSLVDALKSAVEREPQRRDLRIKLLETYYAAAATNRQGFLDTVRKIAHERASLNDGEWDKIAWMGRQIASDDNLFAPVAAQSDEEELANCA